MYRDDRVVAFLDIGPATPGHLMVVPIAHLASLADLPEDLGAHLFVVASRLAAALRRSGLPCDGVNLFLADGEAAFQDVFHVHLHVIARTPDDGFTIDSEAWSRPEAGTCRARRQRRGDPRGAPVSRRATDRPIGVLWGS